MKIKEIPILKQEVLKMLPVTQSDVWKRLNINSHDGARLINIMIGENLIKRTKQNRTFLLECISGNGHIKKLDRSVLLSNGKFSPCCGCSIECFPPICMILTEWLLE